MTREGNGTPLQYSCLENPMDGGAWWDAVHGVAEGRTRLRDFTFTFHFHALEKEIASHSSVLAWRIPGMGEPGGLSSMGLHRVGQDWSDLAAAAESVNQFENNCRLRIIEPFQSINMYTFPLIRPSLISLSKFRLFVFSIEILHTFYICILYIFCLVVL